jgi:hypothetical protein
VRRGLGAAQCHPHHGPQTREADCHARQRAQPGQRASMVFGPLIGAGVGLAAGAAVSGPGSGCSCHAGRTRVTRAPRARGHYCNEQCLSRAHSRCPRTGLHLAPCSTCCCCFHLLLLLPALQGSWLRSVNCDTGFRDYFRISLQHGAWDAAAWAPYAQQPAGVLRLTAKVCVTLHMTRACLVHMVLPPPHSYTDTQTPPLPGSAPPSFATPRAHHVVPPWCLLAARCR